MYLTSGYFSKLAVFVSCAIFEMPLYADGTYVNYLYPTSIPLSQPLAAFWPVLSSTSYLLPLLLPVGSVFLLTPVFLSSTVWMAVFSTYAGSQQKPRSLMTGSLSFSTPTMPLFLLTLPLLFSAASMYCHLFTIVLDLMSML